ncbi:hypothetical protein CBR_g30110 [Chara braunii]|uniref:SET domain-containing protein n=1 Tax=Chara braunii TaxID=69332 RepID=A0A388LBZ3_CHABU|nr:hypothetical protein CBR_g30110 [Chara braunii]|eukprot:GBG79845.1 hypothetical protein CBR_g30110 [Chara braunii]
MTIKKASKAVLSRFDSPIASESVAGQVELDKQTGVGNRASEQGAERRHCLPPSPDMASRPLSFLDAFIRWMALNGIRYTDGIHFSPKSVSGFGVVASRDLKVGEVIATIPKYTMSCVPTSFSLTLFFIAPPRPTARFNHKTAAEDVHFQVGADSSSDADGDSLAEAHLASDEENGEDDEYANDSADSDGDRDGDSDGDEMGGEEEEEEQMEGKDEKEEEGRKKEQRTIAAVAGNESPVSRSSRLGLQEASFGIEDGHLMGGNDPILDPNGRVNGKQEATLGNSGAPFAMEEESEDLLEMTMVRDVAQGSEVFNTFGELSTAALLLRYGFTGPNNPFDIVNVDLSMVERACCKFWSAEHVTSCTTLWQKMGFSPCESDGVGYFEIEADGKPQIELLVLLLLCCLSEQGCAKLRAGFRTEMKKGVKVEIGELCRAIGCMDGDQVLQLARVARKGEQKEAAIESEALEHVSRVKRSKIVEVADHDDAAADDDDADDDDADDDDDDSLLLCKSAEGASSSRRDKELEERQSDKIGRTANGGLRREEDGTHSHAKSAASEVHRSQAAVEINRQEAETREECDVRGRSTAPDEHDSDLHACLHGSLCDPEVTVHGWVTRGFAGTVLAAILEERNGMYPTASVIEDKQQMLDLEKTENLQPNGSTADSMKSVNYHNDEAIRRQMRRFNALLLRISEREILAKCQERFCARVKIDDDGKCNKKRMRDDDGAFHFRIARIVEFQQSGAVVV